MVWDKMSDGSSRVFLFFGVTFLAVNVTLPEASAFVEQCGVFARAP